MEINFSNIRTHNGSKNSGFEELVCQIAHLKKPENGVRFVPKDGAGGDAGVECYWILEDESEICWQAKYFVDGMNTSRWKQLDKSFSTALKKHPKLIHYVVCLPIDKADSRKKGRGAKQVTSIEDEWLEHIEKWSGQAKAVDRKIDFSYWGKHEITTFLTSDKPLFSGRTLYWFNEPFLGEETFEDIANKSKRSLGERYSSDSHIELPIVKIFDGLCLNFSWWSHFKEKMLKLENSGMKVISLCEKNEIKSVSLKDILTQLDDFLKSFNESIADKDFYERFSSIKLSLDRLSMVYADAYKEVCNEINKHKEKSNIDSGLRELERAINSVILFAKGKKAVLAQAKAALLHGDAGMGKSHLLCDLSLQRIKQKLPTLFLLGSQYRGGNPISFIKEALDLQGYRDSQVLGAIDAAGEASGTRALIVIDAINEGSYKDEWSDHIAGFLSDLSRFPYIAILLSCRSTYLKYILPDSIDENELPRVQHSGFRGCEHEAAEKFLLRQNISKPSAPMLMPEFTNPLFLKICCQALRQNQQNSFPKGLKSITSIFNFYIESLEKVVAKKKKFNHKESIVKAVLIKIASELFPDNLEGLPVADARRLVNSYDPNPNINETLFNILIYEGVLFEDVSYKNGQCRSLIVRFTYERFSDYFIAQEIIEKIEVVDALFSEESALKKLLENGGYQFYAGIFEALTIIVAEKFNRELEDLLPEDVEVERWELDSSFKNAVLWRSADSFSERTLELLNGLEDHVNSRPSLEILLKLSTEPNHPWNAELLHRGLVKKEIAKRDYLWSMYIALGDSSEEDYEYESTVGAIIGWSYSSDMESVEEERVRLCAITLIWFLTTPNRKIRDRSTKSLVRILSSHPNLVEALLKKFSNVEDTYLTERLYAVAYGVVCNIDDKIIIKNIAVTVFNLVFKGGDPIVNILLRDYARGILEYSLCLKLLPKKISTEKFRPPYKSSFKLSNISKKEIEEATGKNFSASIKNSLMGFPGDFGNYAMSDVHCWSSTPISFLKPQNGFELKEQFAYNLLIGTVQEKYLKKLNLIEVNSPLGEVKSIEDLKFDGYDYDRIFGYKEKEQEEFSALVKSQLDTEQQEYHRWLSGVHNDRPAPYSRKWAQRWVFKRAHEFGWHEDLFADFERGCSHGRGGGARGGAMERIGKKYQWMAFHELLARLSDNYHWIPRDYDDIFYTDVYEGPWQIHKRDIDPTVWARECGEYKIFHDKTSTWWQPYNFPFPDENILSLKNDFVWNEENLPDFSDLLQRTMPLDGSNWLVLRGTLRENKKYVNDDASNPKLNGWFRISSILIHKGEYASLAQKVEENMLCDPYIVNVPSTQHQGFLGEYPWHSVYHGLSGWRGPKDSFRGIITVKHLIPVAEYEWEDAGNDYSLNRSLSFYMPAKELVQSMGLARYPRQWGRWGHNGQLVFWNPSLEECGPSYALMRTEKLKQWLEENNMEIVWLIAGEKEMFSSRADSFFYRLVYSGLFKYENNKPVGRIWYSKER